MHGVASNKARIFVAFVYVVSMMDMLRTGFCSVKSIFLVGGVGGLTML
jgi:hypothetical protein